ncbi:MAG TPA: helix-hairpin-helix domain-containing protein [Gammaproteobacteria bacterium]|nr:helix-hairpin-helix domain-containing protein [Gammaproteobacteria bacterium]
MKKTLSAALGSMLLLGPLTLLAGPVNVNTADAATLAAELNGVGPALAEAIVRDREANGKFETPEALMRVKGVGQHILDINKDNILVADPATKH